MSLKRERKGGTEVEERRDRQLWCPCRGKEGRKEREKKGGEIGGELGLSIGL